MFASGVLLTGGAGELWGDRAGGIWPSKAEAQPGESWTTTQQMQEKWEEQKERLRKRSAGGNKRKSSDILQKAPELTPAAAGELPSTPAAPQRRLWDRWS